MYASLPRHFTMELAVKTVEQEPDLVAERRELLASKSVSELSQVTHRKMFLYLPLRSNRLPTSQCLTLCNVPSTKAWDLWEANQPKILQNHRQQGKNKWKGKNQTMEIDFMCSLKRDQKQIIN